MSLPTAAATRNRINPLSASNVEQTTAPYVTYDEVALCADPNCPVCRAQRRDKPQKPHKRHHRHHHRKPKTNFWNNLLPRARSASSTISIHNIELDERHPRYSSYVTERAIVPVDRSEREIVSTTRAKRIGNEEVTRDAWTRNQSSDDEIICCRSVNGCRWPCWCCIIIIILFVILIIILIVLLATLL